MFGKDTFNVRVVENCMAPRIREGDYAYVDPDEPATHGRLVAVWDKAQRGTLIRLLIERDGRRVLRTMDESCPDQTVDSSNETDIQGVVVFVGRRV